MKTKLLMIFEFLSDEEVQHCLTCMRGKCETSQFDMLVMSINCPESFISTGIVSAFKPLPVLTVLV